MPKTKKAITPEAVALFEGRLDRIREALGCRTQVDLAERIGVKQSSISDAKRRCSIPSDWLLTIWRTTGISPEWILDGDGCGHKFLAPTMDRVELVNAARLREKIEAQVRAEVDSLSFEELVARLEAKRPDILILTGPALVQLRADVLSHPQVGLILNN